MKIKNATRDFNINDLPHNRKEVFFDCLKLRWSTILRCGLLSFLFAIPYFIVLFSEDFELSRLYLKFINEEITEQVFMNSRLAFLITTNILKIVTSLILALGLAGLTRVIRQLVWQEPIFFHKDFFEGVKMNWLPFALTILFMQLSFSISSITIVFIPNYKLISSIPFAISLIVVLPVGLYNMSSINVYNNKFFTYIKNSNILLLKSFHIAIVFTLVFAIVYLTNLIPYLIVKWLILIIIFVLLMPYYYLSWFLYSSYVFDKFINKEQYPEIYDKGIIRKK